jgi:hypothetical protein
MEGQTVAELKVHSKHNCYLFTPEQMKKLEQTAIAINLEPGRHTVKIQSGAFDYVGRSGLSGEPLVLLWIYGGKVVNHKTNVEVAATWESLNGYNDFLELEVREPAVMNAFFFDTYIADNDGEVTLSITRP